MSEPTPHPLQLVFAQDERAPLQLVFGDTGSAAPPPQYPVVTAGRITGLRGISRVHALYTADTAGRTARVGGHSGVGYDANVQRPLLAWGRSRAQVAQPLVGGVRAGYSNAHSLSVGVRNVAQVAQPVGAGVRARWQPSEALTHTVRSVVQVAAPLHAGARAQFQQAIALAHTARERGEQALPLQAGARAGFQQAITLARSVREHAQQARPTLARHSTRMGQGVPVRAGVRVAFQVARTPPPGRTQRPGAGPAPWCYVPTLPIALRFEPSDPAALHPLHLLLRCDRHSTPPPHPEPGGTVVVPIRRVYMTVNSLSLKRVDGGDTIPAYGFGMQIDADSWAWAWSATLPKSALPLIARHSSGEPVEVLATINGTAFRLIVGSYTRERQFGSDRIAVKGRGRAAWLDAPYAAELGFGNSAERTAQQLMEDVLTVNGVSMGWDVDFGLDDWLVPAGVWTHQGSYISALLDIAGAAGGYLQPHPTAQTLRVLPRYPAAPWDWDELTPDYELPAAVVQVEGTEWLQRPAYNRIFVEGVGVRLRGDVTRAGTAGDLLAPQVVHPLITHSTAARQRGLAELSNTGRQVHLSLRLPVLADTGVITPGAFVSYVDGGTERLGMVRSTQIDWQAPVLRQVLGVETHEL